MDLGACDTVMPVKAAEHFQVADSPGLKGGQKWEAANGDAIHNLGERICMVSTAGAGENRVVHFQVADVKKPLLSVTRTADMGYGCVL